MAEVIPTDKVSPLAPTGERRQDRPPDPYRARAARPAADPPDPASTLDTASILGIPSGELTPEVFAAIRALMAETERLRADLEATRRHEAYLGRLADRHSWLPLYNRRAFLREMSRALVRAEHSRVSCVFLYLNLVNLADLRRRHGRAAGDRAMVHAASLLRDRLHPSDLLGSMDGYDFVILLMATGREAGTAVARDLIAMLEADPAYWFEHPLSLHVACGLHVFAVGESVRQVIDAAETDLRDGGVARSPAGQGIRR